MMKPVYITAYDSICPLGLTKSEFKKNLIHGTLCLSEIPDNLLPPNFPVKYMGLIPNQILTTSFQTDAQELIQQKQRWIDSLFQSLLINEQGTFDLVLMAHNSGPSLATYYHLFKCKKPTLYFEKKSPLLQQVDFLDDLRTHKLISDKTEVIHFHNMCASVCAAVTYAKNRMQAGLNKKCLIISFENTNNNWPTSATLATLGVLNSMAQKKEQASVPFSSKRAGFIKADALGLLVLEIEPKKDPIAQVLAGAITCDSNSLTDGIEDGSMTQKTMELCLQEAKIEPTEISYINAHGTGTYLNDLVEARGIKRLFSEHSEKIHISSIKSQTGHALCAAGIIEIPAILAMFEENFVAANLNCDFQDKECNLNFVKAPLLNCKTKYALKNSFGFGGYNSSILLKNMRAE